MYDRGDYPDAEGEIDRASSNDLDHLDADLRAQAKHWIETGGASTRLRRAFVAGAVAMAITHALKARESWVTLRLSSHVYDPMSLLEVMRLIVRNAGVARSSVEHDWILACVATWEASGVGSYGNSANWRSAAEPGWAVLLGRADLLENSAMLPALQNLVFLKWAREQFPDDPRLLLAVAEGNEAIETRCAHEFCQDEMTTETLDNLRGRAQANPPDLKTAHCAPDCWPAMLLHVIHDSAVGNLAAFDRLLPVASEFATVASEHPDVRAEAETHIGYLAIRAGRPDAALQPLAIAATSDDTYVRYLAEHFTGRALEMLGRRPDAIAAYRQALAIVPNAASTSTLLAAQLFASDNEAERAEAHTVLESAIAASPSSIDPWDLYWNGDARLWTVFMDRLRKDLRG